MASTTNGGHSHGTGTSPATSPAQRPVVFVPDSETKSNRNKEGGGADGPKNIVLCFDGTGNQYKGDGTETNILRIFRLLNKKCPNQYHYYQPGIGTYAVTGALARTDKLVHARSEVEKVIDLMFGTSLSEHVLSGYKFLMRYYCPGDQIFVFGFSRGAYTARFLAEMLDDVGLLPHGNEEMVGFAWDVFSQWQCRKPYDEVPSFEKEDIAKETLWNKPGRAARRSRANYLRACTLGRKLQGFRKTFSREIEPIKFLGLFDTVNSVPQFETPWIGRASKMKTFPYSARSSADQIWHAVSIDERRVKFRPDLLYQAKAAPDRDPHLLSGTPPRRRKVRERDFDISSPTAPMSPDAIDEHNHENRKGQIIREVWFAGNHGDVGGGWPAPHHHHMAIDHVALVWMVRAAKRAGVEFDEERLLEVFGEQQKSIFTPATTTTAPPKVNGERSLLEAIIPTTPAATNGEKAKAAAAPESETMAQRYAKMMQADVHDCLLTGAGLGLWESLYKWRWQEHIPFRRMDINKDTGKWHSHYWPPNNQDTRDFPDECRIHGSVVDRMNANEKYRPANVLLGGGRENRSWLARKFGTRTVEAKWNPDEWVLQENVEVALEDEYDRVYVRKTVLEAEKQAKLKAEADKAKATPTAQVETNGK